MRTVEALADQPSLRRFLSAPSPITMATSIVASGVRPQETRTLLLRSLPALFIGTDRAAEWVRDSANPSLSFFVAKSPEDALQWIRQCCRPEVLPRLERELERGGEGAPGSQGQSEDDSNYGSPVQAMSTADVVNDGPDSARDVSDRSAGRRDKRAMSDASSPCQPASKRARDDMGAPEPEYITTVGNVNRRKERERRRRLENRLSEVFVTEEEDDMQDAYI